MKFKMLTSFLTKFKTKFVLTALKAKKKTI